MKPEIEYRPKKSRGKTGRRVRASASDPVTVGLQNTQKTVDEEAPHSVQAESAELSQLSVIDTLASQMPPKDAAEFKSFVTSAHRRAQVRAAVAKHRALKKAPPVISGNQSNQQA